LFYEALREVCDKKNTTPSAVCVALGISKSNATNWKNGAWPRLDVFLEIANYLKVNPSKLLPKKEEPR
jgi:transcriptional regulator with XRE-family HTH domain